MPLVRHISTAFAVMLAASAQLAAQNAPVVASSNNQSGSVTATVAVEPPAVNDAATQPVSFAPTEANARVGVRMIKSSAPIPDNPEPQQHIRHSVALMIVGGTILVVGAVVGGQPGTIIMIGGGTVGVIGLIRYLDHP
jgi:hypothetical protein